MRVGQTRFVVTVVLFRSVLDDLDRLRKEANCQGRHGYLDSCPICGWAKECAL
jgi:hypothetical protein